MSPRLRPFFFRLTETVDSALERRFRVWAAVLVLALLACAIAQDMRTPMWTDELITLYLSRQAGAVEIVRATLEGSDGAAPLYAIVVRAIQPWVVEPALAVRLPSTLGFSAMVLGLLAFCRRRLPAAYSLAAALLAFNACMYYATEGRSYGIVLGCAACALVCWQAAVDLRRRALAIPLLAFCVALMTAVHYYSIFFVVPLLLAELARWRTSRQVDIAILIALTSPLFVLGLHYPLIAASAPFQRHFWSPATWHGIADFYSEYYEPILITCALPAVVLAVSAARQSRTGRLFGLSPSEWIVTGAFAVLPACVVALSIFTTHVFVTRYALWAVPAFSVLAVALLCRAAADRVSAGVMLFFLLASLTASREVKHLLERPVLKVSEGVRRELTSLPSGAEPIIVADLHVFMELSYYEDGPIRERLVFPVSRELELRYWGSDTGSLVLTALSRRTNLRVVEYGAALAAHRNFVLAALPGNFLPWHLIESGYRVVPIDSAKVPVLFNVFPGDEPPRADFATTP